MFKRHLDNVFNNTLQLLVSSEVVRQLDAMVFVGPFPLNFSVLLCPTGSFLSLGHLHQIWLPESQLLPGRGCFPEKIQSHLNGKEALGILGRNAGLCKSVSPSSTADRAG